MTNIAIIVAAGASSRCALDIPKQYQKINGKPIISYSIEQFQSINRIDDVIIVVSKKDKDLYRPIAEQYNISNIVIGGKTRQESVFNALEYLKNISPNNVLIHDAARPFINSRIINEALDLLTNQKQFSAVIPVVPIEDTIKKVNKDQTLLTIDRNDLYRVQTPQGFNFELLYKCHLEKKSMNFTDDSTILEQSGFNITTFKGSQLNYKITSLDDLSRARRMYNEYITKTGIGFDVHRFDNEEKKTHIKLGGVSIESDRKIIAHSDGDVLIHALVDALLGSIAAGDIGEHFPPNDEKYKNKNSEFFLKETLSLLEEKNAKIVNIDANIICEYPKISPYKKPIRENIAKLLKMNIENISIKATTTEKLGFTGRKEGVAVQAIANIKILNS